MFQSNINNNYTARIEYSADIAQQKHDYNATAKGANISKFSEKEIQMIEH